MASNDPTDTGGLFIGRRPGTGPVHVRPGAVRGSERRQRGDRVLAALLLVLEALLCLSLFGPQPLAWFWIGSQVEYITGYVTAGITTILLGCMASLMLTMVLAKRVDHAWKLVRRAGGPRPGARRARDHLRRLRRARPWSGSASGSSSSRAPARRWPRRTSPRLGLLDYYKQFEDVDEEELNKVRRARRAREKALALEQVPELDLSGTEWPELPNAEVMNASIFTARGRVNGYPDRHAEDIRRVLAQRHEVEPERIVLGNGAAELLQAAALALLGEGDELLTPVAVLSAVPADGRARGRAARWPCRTCPSWSAR